VASVSLAEAVVQQNAIIDEARRQMLSAQSEEMRRNWADIMYKAIIRIDELCLKRMQDSTYEALRRQQVALLSGLRFPEQKRV